MAPLTAQQIKAQFARARQAQTSGQGDLAEKLFLELLAVLPGKPEILFHLGNIASGNRDFSKALDYFEQAAKTAPDEPAIITEIAKTHGALGHTSSAIDALDRLIRLNPKAPKPRTDKGLLLQQAGDFDRAEDEFRKAIRHNPLNGELYRIFLGTKKLKAGDPLIRDMQKAMKHPKASDNSRMHLGFALGKAMEDSGQHDKVFRYLGIGNDLQRKHYPYDPSMRVAEMATVVRLMKNLEVPQQLPVDAFAPIFVTGMPRSGTTLVERILGSHSDVTTAGETAIGTKLAFALMGIGSEERTAAEIAEDEFSRLGEEYEAQLRRVMDIPTRFVTDKSIQSHAVCGILRRALPAARFVIVRRDPRDQALSIYKNFFASGTHRYSNDLRDIARYLRTFERIVTFWREKMPGQLYEVGYENLTSDPECQSRALVDAVGLEWEDGIREFHKSGGAVKTLSLHQVRQPVHKGSVGAWKRFEKEMQPFIEEWEASA